MKKIQSFAFYALITPVLALGAGSALAQQATDQDTDRDQQSMQSDQDAKSDQDARKSTPVTMQTAQSTMHKKDYDSQTATDSPVTRDASRKENRGYMGAAPTNGMQASNLIGAEVKTVGDENVGPVDDLIIDQNGQVVAIVIGAGGFLGMGEKDVAVGWDDVTRSGTTDEQVLRIDATREDLNSAPEFEERD